MENKRVMSFTFKTNSEVSDFVNAVADGIYFKNLSVALHNMLLFVMEHKNEFVAWSEKQRKKSEKSLLS